MKKIVKISVLFYFLEMGRYSGVGGEVGVLDPGVGLWKFLSYSFELLPVVKMADLIAAGLQAGWNDFT